MVVELARDHLVAGAHDEGDLRLVELAELEVGQGPGLLDDAEGADDPRE